MKINWNFLGGERVHGLIRRHDSHTLHIIIMVFCILRPLISGHFQ